MKDRKSEESFYSKLVNETCSLAEDFEDRGQLLSFEEYFESRKGRVQQSSLDEFFSDHKIIYSRGYVPSGATFYRFQFGMSVLDFPKNWSYFSILGDDGGNSFVLLDDENDPDLILEVTKPLFDFDHYLCFVSHAKEVYLVVLQVHQMSILREIVGELLCNKAA